VRLIRHGTGNLEGAQLDRPNLPHPPLEQRLDQAHVGAQLTGIVLYPASRANRSTRSHPPSPSQNMVAAGRVDQTADRFGDGLRHAAPEDSKRIGFGRDCVGPRLAAFWKLAGGPIQPTLAIRRGRSQSVARPAAISSAGRIDIDPARHPPRRQTAARERRPVRIPYVTTTSLIGPWMAVVSFLKDWEAGLVWLAWWGATAYRIFGP